MHLTEELPPRPDGEAGRNAENFRELLLLPGEFRLPLDGVHEEFQRLRHEHDTGDAVLLHRTHQNARLAADGVDNSSATKEHRKETHRLLQHVAQR